MANKIYSLFETAITFGDSGQSAVLTLLNLAPSVGRISARYDRGAGSIATAYVLLAKIQMETAGVIGETVDILVSWSDGTYADGVIGTADAALTTDKRRNLKQGLIVTVDTTATATDIVARDLIVIPTRYFSIGVWNGSTKNLENTSNACLISLTPVVDEIQ